MHECPACRMHACPACVMHAWQQPRTQRQDGCRMHRGASARSCSPSLAAPAGAEAVACAGRRVRVRLRVRVDVCVRVRVAVAEAEARRPSRRSGSAPRKGNPRDGHVQNAAKRTNARARHLPAFDKCEKAAVYSREIRMHVGHRRWRQAKAAHSRILEGGLKSWTPIVGERRLNEGAVKACSSSEATQIESLA
eukprot:6212639-Pleurochrysis_carterae.AAC.1